MCGTYSLLKTHTKVTKLNRSSYIAGTNEFWSGDKFPSASDGLFIWNPHLMDADFGWLHYIPKQDQVQNVNVYDTKSCNVSCQTSTAINVRWAHSSRPEVRPWVTGYRACWLTDLQGLRASNAYHLGQVRWSICILCKVWQVVTFRICIQANKMGGTMGTADLIWRSDWSVNVCISISCVWSGSTNAFSAVFYYICLPTTDTFVKLQYANSYPGQLRFKMHSRTSPLYELAMYDLTKVQVVLLSFIKQMFAY